MKNRIKPIVVLLADDDPEDREMTGKAFEKNPIPNEFYSVADGEELLDFLNHRGQHAPPALSPVPGLILLDLNMPKMDGREALTAIKADPALRRIPVIILTTSAAAEDIQKAYDLGSNFFISKPTEFASLLEVTTALGQYWFQIVTLPTGESES